MGDKSPGFNIHVTESIGDLYGVPGYDTEGHNGHNGHKGHFENSYSESLIRIEGHAQSSHEVSPRRISSEGRPDPSAAVAVVAQEMSALQALKRLSIGASPTLDPDLPNYSSDLLRSLSGASDHDPSPSSQQSPLNTPIASPLNSPSSPILGDSTAAHGAPFFSSPTSSSSTSPTGQLATSPIPSSPSLSQTQASQLLWVPAHVHPEIAPQEWKTFVQNKVAEIRAQASNVTPPSSLSTETINDPSKSSLLQRKKSRLSRQIKDQESYQDGAEILEKRRSSGDSLSQKNFDELTILALSSRLESLSDLESLAVDPFQLARKLSLNTDQSSDQNSTSTLSSGGVANAISPLSNDSDSVILPSPTSSLRRATRTRYNKHSIRRNRRDRSDSTTSIPQSEKEPRSPLEPEQLLQEDQQSEQIPVQTEHQRQEPKIIVHPKSDLYQPAGQSVSSSNTHSGALHQNNESIQHRREAANLRLNTNLQTFEQTEPLNLSGGSSTNPGRSSRASRPTLQQSPVLTSPSLSTETIDSISSAHSAAQQSINFDPNDIEDDDDDDDDLSRPATKSKKKTWAWLFPGQTTASPSVGNATSPSYSEAKYTEASSAVEDQSRRSGEDSKRQVSDRVSIDKLLNRQPPPSSPVSPKESNPILSFFSKKKALTNNKSKQQEHEKKMVVKGPVIATIKGASLQKSPEAVVKSIISRSPSPKKPIHSTINASSDERSKRKTKSRSRSRSRYRTKPKQPGSSFPISGNGGSKERGDTKEFSSTHRRQKEVITDISVAPIYQNSNEYFSSPPASNGLPYAIPNHQVTDKSMVMYYHRYPLHIERAIYRLSHLKLANPRRPLGQQVLLSNFMYAYLNLINLGYQQQQHMLQLQQQQQRQVEAESAYMYEDGYSGGDSSNDGFSGGYSYSYDYDPSYDRHYESQYERSCEPEAQQDYNQFVYTSSTTAADPSSYPSGIPSPVPSTESTSSSSSSSGASEDLWQGETSDSNDFFYDSNEIVEESVSEQPRQRSRYHNVSKGALLTESQNSRG